jgi:hypothetical protein
MMTQNHSFAIEIYKKMPHLKEVCSKFSPFPPNSIMFGVAKDELPVMFDIEPRGSANTMVWDRVVGQGLRLIKVAIEFILMYMDKKSRHTEFVILSNNTREWLKLAESELGVWSKNECIGVVPFWDVVADQVIFALSGWCVAERGTKKPVIVFIDGFENVLRMGDKFQHNLKAILTYGRKFGVFVIASARSENRQDLSTWLDFFQAEIYGQGELEWFEMEENKKSILFWTPETTI